MAGGPSGAKARLCFGYFGTAKAVPFPKNSRRNWLFGTAERHALPKGFAKPLKGVPFPFLMLGIGLAGRPRHSLPGALCAVGASAQQRKNT
jgi:hypothetical protein